MTSARLYKSQRYHGDARKAPMIIHRPFTMIPPLLLAFGLVACTAETAPTTDDASAEDVGHGVVAGAAEVAEPPLALLSVDDVGHVGLLDLLDGSTAELGEVGIPSAVASDGRYGFVSTAKGLEIIDSGRWTWDHIDHFHYYLTDPRVVGVLPGKGPAQVATGMLPTAGSTGVFFSGSQEAVLLDNTALAEGKIQEHFRIETGSDAALIAPFRDGAVVADAGELAHYSADGVATETKTACHDPSDTITTRVTLVVGCEEGAVLISTPSSKPPVFETVPYPKDSGADRALTFDGRKGRPTVAARTGTTGFWLLDTRERTWQYVPTEVVLERVVSVDDADGHVVALDSDGRVRVYLARTGEEIGVTEPLVSEVTDNVSLTVDDQRAYINDSTSGVVLEIAYSGETRVARTLETATAPYLVAEVGR